MDGNDSGAEWNAADDGFHSLLVNNEADSMLMFVITSITYLVTLLCNGLAKSCSSYFS